MKEQYDAMVKAIAEFIITLEKDIEENPDGEERLVLADVNGQFIMDRLCTEDDAMDEVANLVKARIAAMRAVSTSEPANNASIVRGYENGGNFD